MTGETFATLGNAYGVSEITIHDCCSGRTWAWLESEAS